MAVRRVLLTFPAPANFVHDVSTGFEGDYEFRIGRTKSEAVELCATAEVLVMISPIREVIDGAKSCKWIHVIGAGVDSYLSIERVRNDSSMVITKSSGIFGIQVSEHVFALLLSLTRGIKRNVLSQRDRLWSGSGDQEGAEVEISGKNMAIVGLGNIGLEVAKRAKAFGLAVTGVSRSGSGPGVGDHSQYFERVLSTQELSQALRNADIVVDALPLTSETRSLFNRETFRLMKRGAIFLNVGRGPTVDEEALIEAIEEGRLALVGLDVFASEPLPRNSRLWGFDNVIVSPHRAGRSERIYTKAIPQLRENLARFSRGEPLTSLVEKTRGY